MKIIIVDDDCLVAGALKTILEVNLHLCCSQNCANALAASTVSLF